MKTPRDLMLRAAATVHAWIPVATRLLMGQAFLLTGLGKWRHLERTAEFFASSGIPAPGANAVLVASVELVGGICLLAGFATRTAALLLAGTMVVALATADSGTLAQALTFSGDRGLTDVTPLVFLLFLVWLFAAGSGRASVDALLQRGRGHDLAASA